MGGYRSVYFNGKEYITSERVGDTRIHYSLAGKITRIESPNYSSSILPSGREIIGSVRVGNTIIHMSTNGKISSVEKL